MERFSEREIEILRLMTEGLSNREISQRLALSPETIKWYNKQLFSKLGVSSRARAAAAATEYGLLNSPGPSAAQEGVIRRSNLPAQLNSYVGRTREISELKELLRSSRLVVLTGAGGTGKTRLALQIAAELQGNYREGAWLAELATLNEPGLVPDVISRVFDLNLPGDASLVDGLKRFLAPKHVLLLLDNFEHLLGAAPLIGELLAAAPQLTVLATSREPTRIYGEHVYPVEPLPLPSEEEAGHTEQLLANESVALFVQRARAARPSLRFDSPQVAAAARICHRLDGLPLAIELAASVTDVFAPSVLAERLAHDLWSLPDGRRDAPARHATLQAAIDWSYRLLDPDEQAGFRRLSVFRGGATLEGIEAVCRRGRSTETVRLVTSLVGKNFLQPREDHGEPRFTMLETVREFAAAHLESERETEVVRLSHAAYFAELSERADREFRGPRNAYWMRRLRSEHQNFAAALDWSLHGPEPSYGLRLAASLDDHWYYNGFFTEGRHWTDLAEQRSEAAPAIVRARLLRSIGNLGYARGDLGRSRASLEAAVELYRAQSDERGTAWCLASLALTGLASEGGRRQGVEWAELALEIFRRSQDRPGEADALNILGELARVQGDDDRARRYYEECLNLVQQTGETVREGMQYENLGVLAYRRGDYQLSRDLIRRGMTLSLNLGTNYGLASHLATLAGPVAALGQPRKAARLLGAANTHLQALGLDQQPADQPDLRRFLQAVLQALGEDEFQAEWDRGQAMTLQEAVDWALSDEAPDTDLVSAR